MAEYVNEGKPMIIVNETDSDFNVGVGVIFRKSGIYEISVNDRTTTVTKVSERKKGEWEMVSQHENPPTYIYRCSECRHKSFGFYNFCPNCGADMREDSE